MRTNREYIDQFLRQYTDMEREFMSDCKNLKPISKDILVKENDPDLFVDDQFLTEWENIGIYKHQRFCHVLPHMHNYIELSYIWSGEFVQYINGKKVILKSGDVCILNTGTVHAIERCGEEDIAINILMRKEFFDYAFLGRMTKQGILAEFLVDAVTKKKDNKNYLVFHNTDSSDLHRMMESILCEYYSKDIGMREVLESYMIIVFTELLRIYLENTKKSVNEKSDYRVLEMLEYIEKNYQSCTLSSVARHFGFNAGYLTAQLKEKTGRSFVEHVQEQKLNQARLLLSSTNASVTEIVTQCGYQNLSFFYKKFKAAEGMTPAQYRAKSDKISANLK